EIASIEHVLFVAFHAFDVVCELHENRRTFGDERAAALFNHATKLSDYLFYVFFFYERRDVIAGLVYARNCRVSAVFMHLFCLYISHMSAHFNTSSPPLQIRLKRDYSWKTRLAFANNWLETLSKSSSLMRAIAFTISG